MIGLRLDGYDPDLHHDAAVAFCIRARDDELFSPRHQHRKGQLILALHGAITCEVVDGSAPVCRLAPRLAAAQ